MKAGHKQLLNQAGRVPSCIICFLPPNVVCSQVWERFIQLILPLVPSFHPPGLRILNSSWTSSGCWTPTVLGAYGVLIPIDNAFKVERTLFVEPIDHSNGLR